MAPTGASALISVSTVMALPSPPLKRFGDLAG
jgi:hypothetical protein